MKNLLAITVAGALTFGIVGHALAGTNGNVELAIDMQAKSKTRSCATMASSYTSCSVINRSLTVAAGAGNTDVIPVVYNFQGITAVGFGLDWGSSSILYAPTWTKCSDLEITTVGTSHASFELSWGTCQSSAGGTAGKACGFIRFTTYGVPGTVVIGPSASGSFNTVDCAFQPDGLHTVHNGYLNGATATDLDPCTLGPTATEATTWSGVKALYR